MAALRSGPIALAVVLAVVCTAASMPAHAQARLETHGDQSPVVSAGRDATVNYGYTPVQVKELIAAATGSVAADAREARGKLADLERRLGVTEGATLTMLRTLGQTNVPLEQLPEKLAELAQRHTDLLERLRRVEGIDPDVARLKEEARGAVERGDYGQAEALLARATAEDIAAIQSAQDTLNRRRLSAAATMAAQAELAGLRLGMGSSAADAVRLYLGAVELLPDTEYFLRSEYLIEAGGALLAAGNYVGAEALTRRALVIREAALGLDHLDIAKPLEAVGNLLDLLGRPAEGERYLRRALSVREATLGPDHPSVADSLEALASTLRRMGRHSEAEGLLRRAIELSARAPAPTTRDATMNSASLHLELGVLLRDVGRYRDALEPTRRGLALIEQTVGPNHPIAGIALINLAMITLETGGKTADAEAMLRRAYGLLERGFGDGHPIVGNALNALGMALQKAFRFSEAEDAYRRAFVLHERALGPDHPETSRSLNNLATVLASLGRMSEAVPLLRRALAIHEATLGADHPLSRQIRTNLIALGWREPETMPAARQPVSGADASNAGAVGGSAPAPSSPIEFHPKELE